jgi:hypothetical protein
MYGGGIGRRLRRGALDFVLALALFWTVAFAVSLNHSRAFAVPLPPVSNGSILRDVAGLNPVNFHAPGSSSLYLAQEDPGRQSRALALLSLAFAGLVAFNLAFWRHLRRAYASPRRGVWRRG